MLCWCLQADLDLAEPKAIKGQGHTQALVAPPLSVSSNSSKQGEGHLANIQSHTPSQIYCSICLSLSLWLTISIFQLARPTHPPKEITAILGGAIWSQSLAVLKEGTVQSLPSV